MEKASEVSNKTISSHTQNLEENSLNEEIISYSNTDNLNILKWSTNQKVQTEFTHITPSMTQLSAHFREPAEFDRRTERPPTYPLITEAYKHFLDDVLIEYANAKIRK